MTSERRTGVGISGSLEADALTGWRKLLRFRPGQRKAAKTSFNRRVRHQPIALDPEDRSAAPGEGGGEDQRARDREP